MSKIHEEYEERGVEVLAVNVMEDEESYRRFLESTEHELRWVRADEDAAEPFGLSALPAQVIIGPEGRIRWTSSMTSMLDPAAAVRKSLDEVLGDR